MMNVTLTKTRILEGVWHGVLSCSTSEDGGPSIEVTHLGQPVDGVSVSPQDGNWLLRVPIPAEKISDGVQTFIIRDVSTDEVLETFSIMAGDPLSGDLRVELNLLREELDLLKRAFRHHCRTTG
jgi:hypothetical protein